MEHSLPRMEYTSEWEDVRRLFIYFFKLICREKFLNYFRLQFYSQKFKGTYLFSSHGFSSFSIEDIKIN